MYWYKKLLSYGLVSCSLLFIQLLQAQVTPQQAEKAPSFDTEALAAIADRVDSNRIKEDLLKLVQVRQEAAATGNNSEVISTIAGLFASAGLQVRLQPFTRNGYAGTNIIARIPGTRKPAYRYLLTAHYDIVKGSPGADDNASGIAGMLEAARALATERFAAGIEFVAFDLEERGLYGSQQYLATDERDGGPVMGAYNFDMIGYCSSDPGSQLLPNEVCAVFPTVCNPIKADSSRGDFVLLIANESSRPLAEKMTTAVRACTPALKQVMLVATDEAIRNLPGLADSDQKSFWEQQINAVHIGDGGPTRNPHYHSPGDTPQTVTYSFITNIVKATTAALALLAEVQALAGAPAGSHQQ